MPWLVRLAERGAFRQEELSPKQIVYEATFEVTAPQQLAAAFSLASELVHHHTAEVFVAGQALTLPMAREVLRCYQQSGQVEDARAYCWFRHAFVDQPGAPTTFMLDLSGQTARWLFPCKAAVQQVHRIHPEHPASLRDQVEAALVAGQTWWCPRINLDEWEPVQWIRPIRERQGD